MKKRIQIPFQHLALLILLGVGTANISFGQQSYPIQQQRTVANPQSAPFKAKVKAPNNKAGTLIWGAGSIDTTSNSLGQFRNGFSTGALSATQWSAISVNHSSGAVTPGAAYWVRNTTGFGQGSFYGIVPAIASPSQSNGIALFDSDELDNAGGGISALGTGTAPANHKGELISPRIDLTGYTDSALALSFYTQWRNFGISEFSASLSVDDGVTWTSQSILTVNPPQSATSQVNLVFANATVGVTNLTNCKIKFTFDGNYYYAMIDDVSLNVAEPYDLTIATADPTGNTIVDKYDIVQITDNASIPIDQLTGQGFRFGANVKNIGYQNIQAFHNANLNLTIQREVSSVWTTVHQQSAVIDTINPALNGTVVIDSLNNTAWATVGSYRAIYHTSISSSYPDADPSNDSLIQNFEINAGNYWSKVGVNSLGQPSADRPLFPGGGAYNRFEFGSVFSTNSGIDLDSVSYQYYTTTTYSGPGNQVVRAYVYEWNDSAAGGTIDRVTNADRNNAEFTIVGSGVDSLSGLAASGNYFNSLINMTDTSGNKLILLPNSHYLITLALEGSALSPSNSIWIGTSTERSYALNTAFSSGIIKTTSHLFLEDQLGTKSGNWVGFGLDIVPSFGLHTTVNPCVSFSASTVINSAVSCNAGADGAITANASGGSGTLTYLWSNAATTASITGLAAGTYTVTVSDAIGCTATSSSTITEPTAVSGSITSTNVSCNGAADGTANITTTGATAPYTYLWSTAATTATVNGLAAATYTVTTTDANGCTATSSTTITEPSSLISSVTIINNAFCSGFFNGTAKAIVTGGTAPYTYLWNNAATTDSITGLSAGTYSVTITDANGCTATSSATTTPILNLTPTILSSTNVSCNGSSDGTATAGATGGTVPYSYSWNSTAGSQTTATALGLPAGVYSVVVSDANGCTNRATATITEPTALTPVISSSTNVSCNGSSDGAATASSTGGTAPYTYLWSNAATTATATGLAAGTYTVIATDANGCTATSSATVTEPTALTSTSTSTNVSCNGGTDGTATNTSAGGTAPYTYLWSNTSTTATATGLAAGTYTVTATDANGCTATSSATVTEPTVLTSTSTSTNVSCNGGADGTATNSSTGGTAPYTYLWSNAATTATATGLAAGTYTVTATDANGCTATSSAIITEPNATDTTIGRNNVTLTANQTGATYQWLDCNANKSPIANAILQTYTAASNGSYAVEITLNGCTDTSSCVTVLGVGVNEQSIEVVSLNLYPNPNNGQFTLELDEDAIGEVIQVYNLTGSLISTVDVTSNKQLINLPDLSNGIYFVRYKNNTKKFVVSK